jgi:hypothetical protein
MLKKLVWKKKKLKTETNEQRNSGLLRKLIRKERARWSGVLRERKASKRESELIRGFQENG